MQRPIHNLPLLLHHLASLKHTHALQLAILVHFTSTIANNVALILHITTTIHQLPVSIILHHLITLKHLLSSDHQPILKPTDFLHHTVLIHSSSSITRAEEEHILSILSIIRHTSILVILRCHTVLHHLPHSHLLPLFELTHSLHLPVLQHTSLPFTTEQTVHSRIELTNKGLFTITVKLCAEQPIELNSHSHHLATTVQLSTLDCSILVDEAQSIPRGEIARVLRNGQNVLRSIYHLLPVSGKRRNRNETRHETAIRKTHDGYGRSLVVVLLEDSLFHSVCVIASLLKNAERSARNVTTVQHIVVERAFNNSAAVFVLKNSTALLQPIHHVHEESIPWMGVVREGGAQIRLIIGKTLLCSFFVKEGVIIGIGAHDAFIRQFKTVSSPTWVQ